MTSSLVKLQLSGTSRVKVPQWFIDRHGEGPNLVRSDVDISLATERRGASFDTRQMTYFLDGGRDHTLKIEYFRHLVALEPVFRKEDRQEIDLLSPSFSFFFSSLNFP